jgi:DNA polymerase III delta prime subunit
MSDTVDALKKNKTLANATLLFGEDQHTLHQKTLELATTLLPITPSENVKTTLTALTELNKHPDFIFHSPETSIKIDDIKRIQERLKYGPSHHPKMLIIIDHCHLLTKEAANGFLKTIEEPPPNVHFIFLTTSKAKVLPTIRSRCNPLYIFSTNKVIPPDPYIDFLTLKKLPLTQQHKQLEPYFKDKSQLKQLLYSWINESWSTHPNPSTLPQLVPQLIPIINCLNALEYNVNSRLQLEALMLSQ